jgi:tetratricopeptide (TPR) repeat protein
VARPGIAELWYELGHLELRDGRAEDAIASFGQFASLRPDSPRGPRSMAEALLALGRGEDAVAQVALALELTPAADREQHAGITDIGIRAALSRDDAITARRLAAEAQAAHPSLALGPYVEGRLLHAHGDFAGALPLLEDALAVSVERAVPMGEINWYLGDTLLRLDRYEEAEDAFRRELELWPQNIRAYASLATLYRASHRDRAADDTVEALARAVPTAEGRKLAARLRSLAGEKPAAAKF